jgi:hypothetical protein
MDARTHDCRTRHYAPYAEMDATLPWTRPAPQSYRARRVEAKLQLPTSDFGAV